jgi:hypothetical protein
VTLVWAAVIGILGALVTECFRRATDLLHFLFTGSEATIITSFERLPLWQRFLGSISKTDIILHLAG